MRNFRSILEGLDDSLSILREGGEEEGQEQEPATDPNIKAEPEDPEPEPEEEVTQDVPAAEESMAALGRALALQLFGKRMDNYPSRVNDLSQTEGFKPSDKLAPFLESFQTLNKPLVESERLSPTIHKEDVEWACALYVVAEATGLDYDKLVEADESVQVQIFSELTEEQLDEIAPFLAAAGRVAAGAARGALSIGKRVVVGAGKLAAKGASAVGRGAMKAGGHMAKEAGKAAGAAAVDRASQKAKAAMQTASARRPAANLVEGSLSEKVQAFRASLDEMEKWGLPGKHKLPKEPGQKHKNPAPSQSGYGKNYCGPGKGGGDTGKPKIPKGQQDRNPGRGNLATDGIPVSESSQRRTRLAELLKKR